MNNELWVLLTYDFHSRNWWKGASPPMALDHALMAFAQAHHTAVTMVIVVEEWKADAVVKLLNSPKEAAQPGAAALLDEFKQMNAQQDARWLCDNLMPRLKACDSDAGLHAWMRTLKKILYEIDTPVAGRYLTLRDEFYQVPEYKPGAMRSNPEDNFRERVMVWATNLVADLKEELSERRAR